jgi:hypothetical protein
MGVLLSMGLLLKLSEIFEQMKQSKILGHFLQKQIFYLLTCISNFKTRFVVGNLSFQKWFDTDVLDFQIELLV